MAGRTLGRALLVVGVVATLAWIAVPASASLTPYSEGPGDTPAVKPSADGTNHWYWEEVNNKAAADQGSVLPVVVCFRFKRNTDPERTPPSGVAYTDPPAGQRPVAGCDDPTNPSTPAIQPGGRVVYDWFLSGLANGDKVRWCAAAYTVPDPSSNTGTKVGDDVCSTTVFDSAAPLVSLVLADEAGRQGATNDPNGITRTIRYADDVSPAAHDVRVCVATDRACANDGVTPFDYNAVCSAPVLGMVGNATCGFNWPLGDQRIYQCALVFDSSHTDRQPALDQPPSDVNPDYSAAGSGNFAIGCDSIALDRAAPVLSLSVAQKRPVDNADVAFTATGADSGSGLAGPWKWSFGDGTTTTTAFPNVIHRFAVTGDRTVTVSNIDAAGNVGVATAALTVLDGDALKVTVPKTLKPTSKSLTVAINAGRSGTARVSLRRLGRAIYATTRALDKAAVTGHVKVPFGSKGAKPGLYQVRVAFVRKGSSTVGDVDIVNVRVRK